MDMTEQLHPRIDALQMREFVERAEDDEHHVRYMVRHQYSLDGTIDHYKTFLFGSKAREWAIDETSKIMQAEALRDFFTKPINLKTI